MNIQEIFHQAQEIDSSVARAQFLDQACVDSPEMREQVERLLHACEQAPSFLETPPEMTAEHSVDQHDEDETKPPQQSPSPKLQRIQRLRRPEILPRKFCEYELLEKVAQGGMGVVYKARQVGLNRIVAVKMILSGQFASEDEVQRFYVEAEAAGKLDHAGIVPVFDVGCHRDQHYFSMAYVDGPSLAKKISNQPLPPKEAAVIARKLAIAIQAAHEQGIVHRDLKPGNVLIDERDEPRITDFGLAKRVEGDSKLTATGIVLGTPSYMAPEQAAGKSIDSSADIYSLGAILYAMLTGRPPFEAESQLETILQVVQGEPEDPRKINRQIPRDLEAICLKCLERDPQFRYQTATEMAEDLQRFLSGEPILAKNDLRRRIRKWTIREPVLASHLAATFVLLGLLLLNFWIWGEKDPGLATNARILQENVLILFGWAAAVFALQKLQNIYQTQAAIPWIWAAINPIFLTVTLSRNLPPREWLTSVYFLMIVTICFFRRVDLVAITTVVSLLGYMTLLIFHIDDGALGNNPSYKLVQGVIMAGTGVLLCVLTNRLKQLGEQTTP